MLRLRRSYPERTPARRRDAEGRLTSVAGQNFIYDAEGHRVMKDQVSANTWDKMYWHGLGGETLMESDFSGGNQTEHIYFPVLSGVEGNGQRTCPERSRRIAKRNPNGTAYYFFDDHLGNTRVTTDAGGNVVDEFDPYPHGWFRTISFTSGDWYLYTGHEYDPDTGLHYMQARHYSPAAGRFLQTDPVMASATEPQSLNRYSYVVNNPTNLTDPTGTTHQNPDEPPPPPTPECDPWDCWGPIWDWWRDQRNQPFGDGGGGGPTDGGDSPSCGVNADVPGGRNRTVFCDPFLLYETVAGLFGKDKDLVTEVKATTSAKGAIKKEGEPRTEGVFFVQEFRALGPGSIQWTISFKCKGKDDSRTTSVQIRCERE